MDVALRPLLFETFDFVWARLRARIADLDDEEYRWEPTAEVWTVREKDGRWVCDWVRPDPVPPPITTIAWRLWHIADCLASYVAPHLGEWPLPGEFGDWTPEAATARERLELSYVTFSARIADLGEDGLRRELGPAWGPYEHDSWAALVLHALDEVAHHGAEIGLLRDLYRDRTS